MKQLIFTMIAVCMIALCGCSSDAANNLGATDDDGGVYSSNIYWEGYGINSGYDEEAKQSMDDMQDMGDDMKNDMQDMGDDMKDSMQDMGQDMQNIVDGGMNNSSMSRDMQQTIPMQ